MSKLERTITHWTGGGHRAGEKDRKHYHLLTEVDGNRVHGNEQPEDNIVTSDGDYAAHVRNLNTGSIGTAMCGMHGATEVPLSFGDFAISERQFEAHCQMLAEIHTRYAIPVTPETCLTHAEVEPTLGVKQAGKWDFTVLPFKPELRGAIPIGNYLRERVAAHMRDLTGAPVRLRGRTVVLRQGPMRSVLNEELQTALTSLGYQTGPIDGIFGRLTKIGVMAFQSDHGLRSDGIVGPKTWSALERANRPVAPRQKSEDDLRAAGSETIGQADAGKAQLSGIAKEGGAFLAAGPVLEVAGQVAGAESTIAQVAALLSTYWWLALLAGGGWIGWRVYKANQHLGGVIQARVESAIRGENTSK